MTNHYPTSQPKKRLSAYVVVGRVYALNKPYVSAYDMLYARKMQVVFFYLGGGCGPADEVSRASWAHTAAKEVPRKIVGDMGPLPLAHACSPLFVEAETGNFHPEKLVKLNYGTLRLTMWPTALPKKNYKEASNDANL